MSPPGSKPTDIGRLLRPDQVQDILNVSRSRTYELIWQGHFVAYQIGRLIRVTEKSVLDYLDRVILVSGLED